MLRPGEGGFALEGRPGGDRMIAAATAILALILGTGYALLMPPFQVPDEFAHFLRAYEVSQGHFVSSGFVAAPVQVGDFIEMFPPRLLSGTGKKDTIGKSELMSLLHQRLDEARIRRIDLGSAAIYSFIPYLPASLAIRTGLLGHAPPLMLLYLGRLAALSVFAILTFVTLRSLPAGQLAIAVLALMPMALHQAASISADAITFAAAFLLIGYTLQLALDPSVRRLSVRHYGVLAGLILLCALCKSNPWMPLLLAIIPAERFGIRRKWPAVVLACAIGLAGTAAWQWVNRGNIEQFVRARGEREIDAGANAGSFVRHPAATAAAIVRTMGFGRGQIVDEFVGKFGWLDVSMPEWQTWGYIALLLLSCTLSREYLQPWQRAWLMFLFLASTVTICVWLAIIDLPASYRQEILAGKGAINSMQGRYLIPIAPLFLLAFSGLPRPRFSQKLVWLCLAFAALASAMAFLSIRRAYYVPENTASEEPTRNRMSLGIYRGGRWILRSYTGRGKQNLDPGGHQPGDIPVTGDWNGDGGGGLGLFQNGRWLLDSNGDQKFDDRDVSFYFGGIPGDVPVTGDWNGDGKAKAGIYRKGIWILDVNGSRSEKDARVFAFGGMPDDIPVTGDWNGNGRSKVGVYRKGLWLLDLAGDGSEKDDQVIPFGGIPGDVPIPGDWNGDGRSRLGIYRHGTWILDTDGNHRMDSNDRVFAFDAEEKGDIPVVLRGRGSTPPATAEKPGISAAALLWVHDSKERNPQSDGPRLPSSSDFETFHVSFLATETRTVRVHLHITPGEGAILWDNVRVVSPKGERLPALQNPDFESAGPAPWMYYGKVVWSLMPLAANGGVNRVMRERHGDGGVCQDVTGLIPGQTYDVSAMARSVRE